MNQINGNNHKDIITYNTNLKTEGGSEFALALDKIQNKER